MVYETAISIGLVFSAFVLIYLATQLKKAEHLPLHLLLIIPSLFILVSHVDILMEIADTEGQTNIFNILTTVHSTYIWIAVFVVAYFLILFTTEVLGWIGDKYKGGKKEKEW